MAKKSAAKKPDTNSRAPRQKEVPAGYVKVQAERAQAYIRPDEGLVVHGVLLGRHSRTDMPGRYYYQIVLLEPTMVQVRDEDDEDEWVSVEGKIGLVVNCDESAALRDLLPISEKTGRYKVWLKWVEKVKIQRGPNAGKNFWRCDIFADPTEYTGQLPGEETDF